MPFAPDGVILKRKGRQRERLASESDPTAKTMFETARLLGSAERSIIVETHRGTRLANVIEPVPGHQQRQFYQALLKRYGENWRERKLATGVYNCAGHVWASRRTSLLEPGQWRLILDEDGYRRLDAPGEVFPGDLVIYADRTSSEILHVAQVLELRPGLRPEGPRIPWVLSKWDAKSGEVMHLAYDVPYEKQGIEFSIEWWTDRPEEPLENR